MPDNEGMQEKVREAGSEDRTGAAETEADGDAEARATEAATAEVAAAEESFAEDAVAEASHAEDEAPDAGSPAEPVDGQTPISELEAQRDRLRDQHLRLAADFDNFRKRTEDRLRQRWNRAQADLVARFLEPLDDLRRVTALEPESTASVDAIVEGVDLVERKFSRALEEAGVEVVDPGGEDFDPNTMEAMMRVPTESEDDDDTVANVFQRGYTLKGILIRPARVSVFKSD